MPRLTRPLSPQGPVVELGIGPTVHHLRALQKASLPLPVPRQVRGLIDTGAAVTCVDAPIVQALGLPPVGTLPIATLGTGASPVVVFIYEASLTLLHPSADPRQHLVIKSLTVAAAQVSPTGTEVLLGTGLLAGRLFEYDGRVGRFTLEY